RRLAKAIADARWSRLRRWVADDGQAHGAPVVAVAPAYTSQDGSGVLPNGSPCPARVRQALSGRTPICPTCGLLLDRDEHTAVTILARGLEMARTEGRRRPRRVGPWGAREPQRLGTGGLLLSVVRCWVAPAGGSRNLPDESGRVSMVCP